MHLTVIWCGASEHSLNSGTYCQNLLDYKKLCENLPTNSDFHKVHNELGKYPAPIGLTAISQNNIGNCQPTFTSLRGLIKNHFFQDTTNHTLYFQMHRLLFVNCHVSAFTLVFRIKISLCSTRKLEKGKLGLS